jgi:hypothetical protein
MKIRSYSEMKEFKAALDNCTNEVWLMGPNDEYYNMKKEEDYINGMIRLCETDADQLGIFTTSCHDEAVMMPICEKLAA